MKYIKCIPIFICRSYKVVYYDGNSQKAIVKTEQLYYINVCAVPMNIKKKRIKEKDNGKMKEKW